MLTAPFDGQEPDQESIGYRVWKYLVSDPVREVLGWAPDLGAEDCIYFPRAIALLAQERLGPKFPLDEELETFRPLILKALRKGDLETRFWFEGQLSIIDKERWGKLHLQHIAFDGQVMLSEFRGGPPVLFELDRPSGYLFVTRTSFDRFRAKRRSVARSSLARAHSDAVGGILNDSITADRWESLVLWVRETGELQGEPPKYQAAVKFLEEMGIDRSTAREAIKASGLVNRRGRPTKKPR